LPPRGSKKKLVSEFLEDRMKTNQKTFEEKEGCLVANLPSPLCK